jgi:hypothetical protein
MLGGGYIGDGFPLCSMLPEQSFLKVGASYVLTGRKSAAWLLDEQEHYRGRFEPTPGSSALYEALCGVDQYGTCTWPAEVKLTENLPCDGEECDVDEVTTVKMVQGDTVMYYTARRQICVREALFNGAVSKNARTQAPAKVHSQCANPQLPQAGATCCKMDDDTEVSCLSSNRHTHTHTHTQTHTHTLGSQLGLWRVSV